ARQIFEERALAAERLADAVGANRPQVDPARGTVEVFGEAAELGLEERQILCREVRPGLDPEPGHLLRPARPDAVEAPDRDIRDEGRALARADHAQAVRLVLVARELGEELVVADARARGEPGFGADFGADACRYAGRRADPEQVVGYV